MTPMEQLKAMVAGKKVAFIGAGVSHKPCITMLAALGADIALCDQKKSLDDFGDYANTLRKLNVKLSLGEHYTDGFAGQDIIMRTPGYEFFKPELQAAKQAGALVTSEVELFFELCPCEIVAVTGSDGKTTTTTLIAKMFEAAGRKVFLGGNIGAALLPQLPDVTPADIAVVELSSFQLISMRKSPKVAVVTNVTPTTWTTTRICRSILMPNATFCFGRSHPAAPYWVMRTISPGAWPPTAKVNSSGSPACTRPTTVHSCERVMIPSAMPKTVL